MNGHGINLLQDSDKIIKGANLEFPYTKGIGQILFEKLKNGKTKIAQIDAITGEKDTYEDFTKRCIRTAITMRSRGITSDDVITVCSNNHLNTCVPIIASYFLDVKMAHTDPRFSLSDTIFLLNQVRPKIVFVSTNSVKLIEEALQEIGINSEIVVFGETVKHTPFSEYLNEHQDECNFKPVEISDLNRLASVFFSSGTTGLPKGICLNHKTILAQTVFVKKTYELPDVVVLTDSPPYWLSLTLTLVCAIIYNGCRVVINEMKIDTMWQLIEKHRVTQIILAPSSVVRMCQSKRPDNVDISSLRLLLFGGSNFTKQTMETARSMLPRTLVFTAYGQTELGGVAVIFQINNEDNLNMALQKIMSSGQIAPGFSFKVVDIETGKMLGPHQSGEIRIKSEYQMNGYYNIDASDQWDEDGFLKTGDLGYYDEDKCLYIIDRLKEMFKYQGWQITPAKIEAILMKHPAIKTAIVIGMPHPIDNDHPMAVVVLKGAHADFVTAEDIKQYVDNQVDDKYKLRAGVKIVKEIVETPTGKYRRKYVKDAVIAGTL